MILPDHLIEKLCMEHDLIVPYDNSLLNPASIDIRLGNTLLMEEPKRREWHEILLDDFSKEKPFVIEPGEFVLGQSLETFNVPEMVAGQFALKSSNARDGFQHLMAGYIDPGFHGSVLTLEIKNARQHHGLEIWPGMRIGQVVWHSLIDAPDKSYTETGRYNGDTIVTPCKGLA